MPVPDRLTYAFGIAYAIAALANAALVIVKETLPGVHEGMNALTGHHWMTHGVIVIGVFLVTGVALLPAKPGRVRVLTCAVAGATVLSGALIAGYYLFR